LIQGNDLPDALYFLTHNLMAATVTLKQIRNHLLVQASPVFVGSLLQRRMQIIRQVTNGHRCHVFTLLSKHNNVNPTPACHPRRIRPVSLAQVEEFTGLYPNAPSATPASTRSISERIGWS